MVIAFFVDKKILGKLKIMSLEKIKIITAASIRRLDMVMIEIEDYLPNEYADELGRVAENMRKIMKMNNDTETVAFLIEGELKLRALVNYIIYLDSYFTVEPMPDNSWIVYVKKDLFHVVNEKLKGSIENVNNKSFAAS